MNINTILLLYNHSHSKHHYNHIQHTHIYIKKVTQTYFLDKNNKIIIEKLFTICARAYKNGL